MPTFINITQPHFIRSRSSDKVLDIPGGLPASGVRIQQFTFHGGGNQRWHFIPKTAPPNWRTQFRYTPVDVTRFVYQIVPFFSKGGFVLDVPGFSTASGARIQLYANNGGINQLWRLVPLTTTGTMKIVSAGTGLVLDIPGSSAQNGTILQQYADNGGLNQQWTLAQAPPATL